MLVLARRMGEKIKIDDNIEVEVLAIKGQHVRLGLTAPSEVIIHRSEVLDRIKLQEVSLQNTTNSHSDEGDKY